jgi:hypothetical protein
VSKLTRHKYLDQLEGTVKFPPYMDSRIHIPRDDAHILSPSADSSSDTWQRMHDQASCPPNSIATILLPIFLSSINSKNLTQIRPKFTINVSGTRRSKHSWSVGMFKRSDGWWCHCALVLETNDPVRTKGARNTTINHNVNTRRERAVEQDPSGDAPRLVGGGDKPRPPMQ